MKILASCSLPVRWLIWQFPFELTKPEKYSTSLDDAREYSTAETYYNAARKRIGLLGNSVPATQCYFLIGVYEMYSLRPLRAWLSFNHACTTFQTCLHNRSRRVIGRSAKRREQRLYWSCLKSECEMREEFDLPPTSLAKVDYPDVFPSPPGGTPEPEEASPAMVLESSDPDFQRSWYYYLSEIASRRIGNRIIHALHGMQPHEWTLVSLRRLQRIAEELDKQVLQWSENIPKSFAIGDESSSDELTFMLRARLIDFQEAGLAAVLVPPGSRGYSCSRSGNGQGLRGEMCRPYPPIFETHDRQAQAPRLMVWCPPGVYKSIGAACCSAEWKC